MGTKNNNVTVASLIENDILIKWDGTKGTVTGTAKNDPVSIKNLYDEGEQKGHFFPVKFKSEYYGKNILVGSQNGEGGKVITPTEDDPYLIIRIESG